MQIEAHYSSHSDAPQPAPGSPGDSPAPVTPILRGNGKISSNREVAVVQADYVALANDLEQAHALTSTLELQLSGKCNELAQIKHIWERTKADMQKFEHDLDALRKERHALANQVQIAMATEHRYERLKREHATLQARTENLENELNAERVLHADARRNVEDLKDELEVVRRRAASAGGGLDPHVRSELLMLRNQIERILDAPATRSPRAHAEPENIDISFSA